MIKQRLEDFSVHVAVIGPAGENRVCFASVNTDFGRNAGRTGIGAIMGSTKPQGYRSSGSKDLPVHDLNS